jgi:NADPH-dependent 2,4-dienoyl-CoA reductase/sulfur reductase-like enzyme
MIETFDLVIVGAGPAGLEAAAAAANFGVKTMLIDSSSKLGGQYFKQNAVVSPAQRKGQALIGKVTQLPVTIHRDTMVGASIRTRMVRWLLALHGKDAPMQVSYADVDHRYRCV